MTIKFISETHQYIVDGKEYPSVSKLLEPIRNHIYRDIDPVVLNVAACRGTAIHKATEIIDVSATTEIPEKWAGYARAYEKFLNEHDVKWSHSESVFCSHKFEFAGTVDRIGKIDDNLCILDIKTTSKIHDALVIPQLSAYEMMYEESACKRGETLCYNLYILQLKNNGQYRLKQFQRNRKIVESLSVIYQFIHENKEEKSWESRF